MKGLLKNFLLSGFQFGRDEYEKKLHFILLNSILAIVIVMLFFLSFMRYLSHQNIQALIDIVAAASSFITIIIARNSKGSIKYSIPILLGLFYFLITFTFRNIGIIGTIWYLVLILAAFFLKGIKIGLFISSISILAIVTIEIFSNVEYSMYQYFYITIPIIISMAFLYLYEQRNTILNTQLQKQTKSLKYEVQLQTKELSKLLVKSKELSNIIQNSQLEIYIVDYKTDRYLYVNHGVIDNLGYSEAELLNMNIYDINTSMIHSTVENYKQLMLKNKNAVNISQHQKRDGSNYGVQSFMHKTKYNNTDAYVIFDIEISSTQKAQSNILKQKENLSYQAYHDTLTKLPNRMLFQDRLLQAIKKAKRDKTKFALLFLDLDHFKEVNDNFGHEAGDAVLIEVAKRLERTVREADTVSRISGDEFLIILEDFDTTQNIITITKHLIEALQAPLIFQDTELIVTCSIGVSIYPTDSEDDETLIKYADRAMYNAKNSGKNNFKFYR